MKKTIIFIVLATLCPILKLSAQTNNQISGRVVTANDGKALPSATINIKNSNVTVQSAKDGTFTILAKTASGTLTIRYTGYQSQEIGFNTNTKTLEIKMQEANNSFDDIQVIGYGKTTKRLNTGSISTINAKQIEEQPVTNVLSALSGRMPGVFIQTTNGLPGGNISVQIRGKGSIAAGTDPLYIVDGVPFEGASPNGTNNAVSTNNIAGNISPLNNINPSDIESINVLKDADATAIYGSRGANGVVLITTKKAKAGETQYSFNLQQGFSRAASSPKLMNLQQYLEVRREAFQNDNRIPSADPTSTNYAPDLTLWSQTEGTDWPAYLLDNTASFTDLQGSISGGKNNTTFSVSGNYRSEGAILAGVNNFQRGGIQTQLNHTSSNGKFTLNARSSLTKQSSVFANPVLNLDRSYLRPPNFPLLLANGEINWYGNSNIQAELDATSKTSTDNIISNLALSYQLLPSLSLKLNSGYTKTSYNQKLIFPSSSLPPGSLNTTSFSQNSGQSFIVEPQIDYHIRIKELSVNLMAGATYQNRTNDSQFIKANDFKVASLMEDLGSAYTIESRQNTYSHYKYASIFGRINLNLKNQYLINATIRRDGSSRFGPGNRYGNFGSIGAAWVFSNNEFIKDNLSWISHGKIRGSIGTSGNDQIGDYQYLSTYSSPGGNLYQDGVTIRPSRISNDDFHWESTTKANIGLEIGLFKEKVLLTADYYRSTSRDQLVSYSLPRLTGFSEYQANLPAVILNTGLEMSIELKIINRSNLNWSAQGNISIPKNRLLSFENFENSSYAQLYKIGEDLTRIRGYQTLGVDPATGNMIYAGQDGNASTTPFDNFTLGKLTPDFYGGFGSSLTYQNFELNVFAQFVRQQSKGDLKRLPGTGVFNNFALTYQRWTPSNRSTTVPKATLASTGVIYPNSSANVFNTSYLRLKNISLSYRFKEAFLKQIKVNSLRLYAEAQNLFTIWNSDAAVFDPESGVVSTTALGRNIPPVKTIVLGLQLNF
ncbi:SusC/RagA family TonB-linked outer membrane protein [Pedobacter rhizosphaerae]|uniref:TonB-linked outer membrane protein, SusC/RagA family n=1 Tax=Pedobacter rhizosphaerae TaxID=390241 RepID=A0A1H9SZJ7_9SPHI|nr:SusC/RagA family TonB-linked outer membrane protein [Pedobacter rhizosphaerae]SER89879.1 TonB-linked outer membrane protein, SusC/RagA family [Pedobacter rhizosphaerae]